MRQLLSHGLSPDMQKPPEIRRLAGIRCRSVLLEEDGRGDQDLGGNGNEADGRHLGDAHGHAPYSHAAAVPAPQRGYALR
jgi:hypothetical protein